MGEIFRQVTAEVSPGFIEHFPSQFDIYGMLKQICDDACLTLEFMNNVYNLRGPWSMIAQAHTMLSNLVPGSHGSRQLSVLVQAAEAISNMSGGVEHQLKQPWEQVEQELLQIEKLKQNSEIPGEYGYMSQIQGSMGTEPDVKSQKLNEAFISRAMSSDACTPAMDVLAMNNANAHVSEYDILSEAAALKEIESNMADTDTRGEHIPGVNTQDTQNVIQVYVSETAETESSEEESEETEQEPSGNLQIVAEQTAREVTYQENALDCDTGLYGKKTLAVQTEEEISEEQDSGEIGAEHSVDSPQNDNIKEDDLKTFSCNQCSFVAKDEINLKDHIECKHLAEKLAQCDVCQKVFANVRYMKRHLASHGDPQYKCSECGKKYKAMKALRAHAKKHSDSYVKPEFKCQECPKVFSSNYVLECHIKGEHRGKKRTFLCQVCGKKFTTKHTLQQHANLHSGSRPHNCEICKKSFTYESALRDHKLIHDKAKKYVCGHPQCDKSFRQRSNLKMHEKIHKEDKDYTCEDCGRGFSQKQALERHIRAHKGLKPYSCRLCKKTFGDAAIIRRHIKLVHKINKDISQWREDIVSIEPPSNDSLTQQSDSAIEQGQITEMNVQSSVANTSAFGLQSEVTTRLPPVTTIQGFRHLDAYAGHDPLSHTLPVSQEQLPPLTSQFSMTMPVHHEFMQTQPAPMGQYSFTVVSTDLPPATEAKSMEPPQADNSKVIHMPHEEFPRLEIDKGEHLQYLDDERWRKYLLENYNRSAAEMAEGGAAVVQVLAGEHKVCEAGDADAVENKDLGLAKPLEAEVHDHTSLMYPCYTSNLPGSHFTMNLSHFTNGTLPPPETSTDTQVQ